MAAQLEIDWTEADWPTADRGEYGVTVLPLSSLFELSDEKGKPALVYVFDADVDEEVQEAAERKAFGREDFIITTKLFRCFRIEEGTLDDEVRRDLGQLPAYIVLDAAGNEVARTGGARVSARRLLRQMSKGFEKKKAKRVKKIVKSFQKHLLEVQKLEDDVARASAAVTALKERLDDNESTSTRKQLKESEAELAELTEQLSELEAKGAELLKGGKPVVAQK